MRREFGMAAMFITAGCIVIERNCPLTSDGTDRGGWIVAVGETDCGTGWDGSRRCPASIARVHAVTFERRPARPSSDWR